MVRPFALVPTCGAHLTGVCYDAERRVVRVEVVCVLYDCGNLLEGEIESVEGREEIKMQMSMQLNDQDSR